MKAFIVLVAVCIASTYAASTAPAKGSLLANKELADKCVAEVGLDPNTENRDQHIAHDHKDKIPCIYGCIIKKNPAYSESKTLQEAVEKVVKAKESTHKKLVDEVKEQVELCKAKVGNDCEYAKCLELDEKTMDKFSPLLD